MVFHWLEDDWSWVDSFYFSVVAVTTVGFGDFAPTTDASKLFAVFYILIGVTIVATALNGRLRQSERRIQTRVDAPQSRTRRAQAGQFPRASSTASAQQKPRDRVVMNEERPVSRQQAVVADGFAPRRRARRRHDVWHLIGRRPRER